MLRVTDGFGLTVCREFVTIRDHMPELEVHLPERESNGAGAGAGTVSVTQLMHPPDKKAVQAFKSALRFSSAGKYEDASSELEKAIHISPEFAEAHSNLAVQYFRLGRFEESIAESTHAIQIGGAGPTASVCGGGEIGTCGAAAGFLLSQSESGSRLDFGE